MKLQNGVCSPVSRSFSTGLPLYPAEDIVIPAKGSAVVKTALNIDLSQYVIGIINIKNSLSVEKGLICSTVIDCSDSGPVSFRVYNDSFYPCVLKKGETVAYLYTVTCKTPVGINFKGEF